MSTQSKIPVPVKRSGIPVRVSLAKGIPRPSLIGPAPDKKTNVIKPIVTKCNPLKKVALKPSSQIAARVTKREQEKPKNKYRQTTLPQNKFISRRVSRSSFASSENEKENVAPDVPKKEIPANISSQAKGISLLDEQKGLNIDFVPNESSRMQILENKALTFEQVATAHLTPNWVPKKPFGISRSSLKPAKKSISKSLKRQSSSTNNSAKFSSNDPAVQKNLLDLFARRATWSHDSPKKRLTCSPKPDAYEVAMASIQRMSLAKTSLSGPTAVPKSCNVQCKTPNAYERAMKKIEALRLMRSAKKEPIQSTVPVIKIITATESPKIDAPVKTFSAKDRNSNIYRPLKNLIANSGFKQQRARLTDISEHSETDSSTLSDRPKTGSFPLSPIHDVPCSTTSQTNCDVLKVSEKRPILASIQDTQKLWLSRQSLQMNFLDSLSFMNKQNNKISRSPNFLHTPRAVSFYLKRDKELDQTLLFNTQKIDQTSSAAATAPIRTPLVMQSIARQNEEKELWSPVKQKLDFLSEPENIPEPPVTGSVWKPVSSGLTKCILTKKMQDDSLADDECRGILSVLPGFFISSRRLYNPIAKTLSEGDSMHFVPLDLLEN